MGVLRCWFMGNSEIVVELLRFIFFVGGHFVVLCRLDDLLGLSPACKLCSDE